MTDEELLRTALQGGESDWEMLHNLCKDRARAETLARVLEQRSNDGIDAAAAWARVLEELHPGLKVNLPPGSSA